MSASLSRLQSFYSELSAPLLLHATIRREFPGTIALLTSFAPDAGLLLSMAAKINPATPVLFLNTGAHPPETLDYIHKLCAHLCLTDIRWLTLGKPAGAHWKAELSHALESMGLLALITGRTNAGLPKVELDENGVFRINPLAGLTKEALNNAMTTYAAYSDSPAGVTYPLTAPDPCVLALGPESGQEAHFHIPANPVNWSV